VRLPGSLVKARRALEQEGCSFPRSRRDSHLAGAAEGRRLLDRVVAEVACLLEVSLRLCRRAERGRSFTRAQERGVGARLERRRVLGGGFEPVGVEEVRGDDLDDFLLRKRSR
jgi:hypothetical protein